jgi:hypothetical protein
VSSVAYHALRLHRLRPPRIAVQPSHVHAFLSRPLGCRICSTTLPVCPGSMSATASWIAGCGSCRSRADVVACDQAKQQGLDVTCVEAMRTAFAAVCTSLSPRQGGVRRPPPRRARGCSLPRLRPRLFGCLLPQGGRRKCATGGDRACDCSPTRRAMHAEPAHEIGHGRRLGTADGVSNVDMDVHHAVYRTAVQVFTSAFDTRPTRRSSSRHRTRWSI